MSRDKLEKFIIDNRDGFDEFTPAPGLFNGIETRKPRIVTMNWNSVMWKAAAVIGIFVGSWLIHDWVNRSSDNAQIAATEQQDESSEIVKMLIEAEAFYTSQIDTKKEEFYQLTTDQPEIKNEIDYELVELDTVYAQLKQDLKDNADNEEVIEAMIQNYRIKLDILESVLAQLQKAKNEEKKNNYEVEL
jgi:hypothetical protein